MNRLSFILLLCATFLWSGNASIVDSDASALQQEDALLKGLHVLYPEPNAQYKSPLVFRFQMVTPDFSSLMAAYTGHRWLCLQLDNTWRRCIPIESGDLMIESIDSGNHTARLVMIDSATPETGKKLLQSEDVTFTVLSDEGLAASLKQLRLDELALYGPEFGEADIWSLLRLPGDASEDVRQAIAYELKIYGGDLLTDVLDCEDSYATLPHKVKEFLHLVGTDHALRRAGYVMIADEDVYVRADVFAEQLAAFEPLTDLYAGHVKEGNTFLPERDPQRRYYLPESVYPLDEFPPFAWGPHYLMSMDVVNFIANNREELQGLGCLDDVTIALWLLAIQVHPQHIAQFQNLREAPCTNDLLAYADLRPSAMQIIHTNLKSGRNFCHSFNRYTWDKDAKKAELA
ncbi:hypothetical protein PInf_007248 [Phytophthora infestans]|nr:hypothetical protein PInf_007248 [Phytophthora infestans]